jgi:hypothetical protein
MLLGEERRAPVYSHIAPTSINERSGGAHRSCPRPAPTDATSAERCAAPCLPSPRSEQ